MLDPIDETIFFPFVAGRHDVHMQHSLLTLEGERMCLGYLEGCRFCKPEVRMYITIDDRGDVRVHPHLTDAEIQKFVHDGLTVLESTAFNSTSAVRVMVFDEDAIGRLVTE